MARKKSPGHSRAQSFKYATPTGTSVTPAPAAVVPGTKAAVSASYGERDFSYVGRDVRRILVFGGVLTLAEVGLWYLFGHSGLGSAVYNLIQL